MARKVVALAAAAPLVLGVVGVASAGPTCSSTSPSPGDTVACSYTSAGGTVITVPVGTASISVDLTGGGGAGGAYDGDPFTPQAGSPGGAGARVQATLSAAGLATVAIEVGAGGGGGSSGGDGGGYSAVYAGSSALSGAAMLVAGGGGGGARGWNGAATGGAGAGLGTSTGGDAASPSWAGGTGGADGSGGIGTPSCMTGSTSNGSTWALGGAGGVTSSSGGAGGSGYGGGGSGCDHGGGAGGSLAAAGRLVGAATFSTAGGSAGAAGTSGSTNGTSGGNGAASLRFVAQTYVFSYDSNGAGGGAAPNAGGPYAHGTSVTVLGNTGSLTRAGYSFAGWNTAADGSGIAYAPGDSFSIRAVTTLYAQWAATPAPVAPTPAAPAAGTPAPAPTTDLCAALTGIAKVTCQQSATRDAAIAKAKATRDSAREVCATARCVRPRGARPHVLFAQRAQMPPTPVMQSGRTQHGRARSRATGAIR